MTNFSGVSRKGIWSWLTPERAVLVVPVLVGLGISFVLFSFALLPLSLRVKEQNEVVDRLSFKNELVPELRRELFKLKLSQQQRRAQLERLLDLLAGNSELDTLLAELNDLAKEQRVEIISTEPGDVQAFTPTNTTMTEEGQVAPPAAGGGAMNETSQDPMLYEGLEKRSVALSVNGQFVRVLAFLQALEKLETLIIVSDLDVKSQVQVDESKGEVLTPEVTMAFNISAYGRVVVQESNVVEEKI